jgi:AcrR family transcriptional regulator
MLPLRQRKVLNSMRHIQDTALDLFEARGFAAVTVEEVAAAADVSPPTIYRHFGSKERLVQWDEYDPMMLAAIGGRMAEMPPLPAIRAGLLAALDRLDADESGRIMRRARLVRKHPELQAASAVEIDGMRRDLAALMLTSPDVGGPFEAAILASTAIAIFRATVDEWLRIGGSCSLRSIFDEAFERLSGLTSSA